jgi:hypothetical protein
VGIGIQLIRTYDSRSLGMGDFGAGWNLDIRNVRLRDNGALGLNWQGTVTGDPFQLNVQYCIEPTNKHIVTVILSDGTVYRFQPTVAPHCQALVPILQATIGFTQISGPTATLALAGDNTVVTQDAWPGPLHLLDQSRPCGRPGNGSGRLRREAFQRPRVDRSGRSAIAPAAKGECRRPNKLPFWRDQH